MNIRNLLLTCWSDSSMVVLLLVNLKNISTVSGLSPLMFYPIQNEYYKADLKAVDLFLVFWKCTGTSLWIMTEAVWDKADHSQVKLNEEKDLAASTRHWKKLAWLAYARTWLGQIPCVPLPIILSATEVWNGGWFIDSIIPELIM